ncbi:MAG: hypothetical protein RR400_01260 [Clostridia bacterium]
MTKSFYSGLKYKPKKVKKQNKGTVFVSIFVVVCLAVSISFADLFSRFITVGNFTLETSQTTSSAFKTYAIASHKSAKKEEAEAFSLDIKNKGGAGYVWTDSTIYYVLASCYLEENDAKKVKENLFDGGIESDIITLEFKDLKIADAKTSDENKTLLAATSSFKNTYKSLYDLSVSYDTKIVSDAETMLKLTMIKNDLEKLKTSFDVCFKTKWTNDLIILKLKLAENITTLESLIENKNQTKTFSSDIKSTYFKILKNHKSLYNELTKSI